MITYVGLSCPMDAGKDDAHSPLPESYLLGVGVKDLS